MVLRLVLLILVMQEGFRVKSIFVRPENRTGIKKVDAYKPNLIVLKPSTKVVKFVMDKKSYLNWYSY